MQTTDDGELARRFSDTLNAITLQMHTLSLHTLRYQRELRGRTALAESKRPPPAIVKCFMNREILPALLQFLNNTTTPHIVGCVYIIGHHDVIGALCKKAGVCILTMDNSFYDLTQWSAAKPIGISGPLRHVLCSEDQLMHHKFFVGLLPDRTPAWVFTGSFNATHRAATRNDENAIATDDPDAVRQFYREFLRLYDLSKEISASRQLQRPQQQQLR